MVKSEAIISIVQMLEWYLYNPLTSWEGVKPTAKEVGLGLFLSSEPKKLRSQEGVTLEEGGTAYTEFLTMDQNVPPTVYVSWCASFNQLLLCT